MKNYQTLDLKFEKNILHLRVNRPEKFNALSIEVLSELKDFFSNCPKELRGVIFTGVGDRAFIAGADIKAMESMTPEEGEKFSTLGQAVPLLMEKLPIPIIACVHGYALGGGLEMAMGADFIYATEKSVFGQPEINLGLIPAFGGTQRLMRLIGVPLAKELIYTGRNVKSEEALRIGLAQRLFPTKEEMILAAQETLAKIEAKPPLALSLAKEVIQKGVNSSLIEGLQEETSAFKKMFYTEDKREGVRAFLEKRQAKFTGK